MTKVAKGKQFMKDYQLFCYKFIFQLALKDDQMISISNHQCESQLVNERKLFRHHLVHIIQFNVFLFSIEKQPKKAMMTDKSSENASGKKRKADTDSSVSRPAKKPRKSAQSSSSTSSVS